MTDRAASRHGSRYRRLVLHLIARDRASLSREDFEELESDCMAAALRAVDDYCPGHSSGATLDSLVGRYILTARLCYLRRHARYDDLSLDSPADPGRPDGESLVDVLADDRHPDLDDALATARQLALVRQIAETLPPGQHRAIVGALEGRSVPEIASHAGISRAAVGEAYRSGVEAVRLELDRRQHSAAAEAAYQSVMKP